MSTFATNGEVESTVVQGSPDLFERSCQCGVCKCCLDIASAMIQQDVDDDYFDCDCELCNGYYGPGMLPGLVEIARQEAEIDALDKADERLLRRMDRVKQQDRRKNRRLRR